MKQMERLTLLEIITMLDKLNDAKDLYENATNKAVRQKANGEFADIYDWFTQQHVAINYDARLHLWFFARQE